MSGDRIRLLATDWYCASSPRPRESAVHSYACDPVVTQFMEWGPNSIEDTRAFLRKAVGQTETPSRRAFDLAVVDIQSQTPIGGAALSVTNVEHRRGEIGYAGRRRAAVGLFTTHRRYRRGKPLTRSCSYGFAWSTPTRSCNRASSFRSAEQHKLMPVIDRYMIGVRSSWLAPAAA